MTETNNLAEQIKATVITKPKPDYKAIKEQVLQKIKRYIEVYDGLFSIGVITYNHHPENYHSGYSTFANYEMRLKVFDYIRRLLEEYGFDTDGWFKDDVIIFSTETITKENREKPTLDIYSPIQWNLTEPNIDMDFRNKLIESIN